MSHRGSGAGGLGPATHDPPPLKKPGHAPPCLPLHCPAVLGTEGLRRRSGRRRCDGAGDVETGPPCEGVPCNARALAAEGGGRGEQCVTAPESLRPYRSAQGLFWGGGGVMVWAGVAYSKQQAGLSVRTQIPFG